MKFLRLILTIYFIALLLMPCSDVKAQSEVRDNHQISMNADNSHSKEKDDPCSPFCLCSCCQIKISTFNCEKLLQIPVQSKIYFSKKILFQKNNIDYQVYDHIWQPPKI